MITNPVLRFLIFWGVNTLSLWVADDLFDGIAFQTVQALFISGLVLGIVARNADAATWDTLHALAKKETSSMVRDQYYTLLATAGDEVLAARALDMALTAEPGATNGAAMISAVSREHPELAFDFAVAHREQVDGLVDSTSRARYYPRLGSGSARLETASRIEAFAGDHIAPTSRREAQNVVAIQTRVKLQQQRRPQIDAWLKQQR